jgi:hypothetical protein
LANKLILKRIKFHNRKDLQHNNKARIFVSCGQKRDNELEVARQILRKLTDMGFDPYGAMEEQSLKGIRENIFSKLEESEYFIFIDFKREKMETGEHRGSLFSHQELAIATFLDKDALIFQETGIKRYDGIISAIQGNAVIFTDRHLLPNVMADKIRELNWKSNWRDELLAEIDENKSATSDLDAIFAPTGDVCRWYLVNIKNMHHRKNAFDCFAYLESIKNISTLHKRLYPPIELKWNVVTVPRVVIPPRYERGFGAFYVPHNTPSTVYFNINTFIVDNDSVCNMFRLEGPGEFEITFVVFSFNFAPVRITCMLEIGSTLNDIKFYKMKQELMGRQEQ